MSLLRTLCLALAAGLLAACAPGGGHPASPDSHTAELQRWHWHLTRALNASGMADDRWLPGSHGQSTPPILSFNDQAVAVSGLCNAMRGGYSVEGSQMQISQLAGTLKMCPDPALMQYERLIAEALAEVEGWHLIHTEDGQGDTSLTLRLRDGSQWVLTGVPTDETRFGGPGDLMFLEIAPQTVACQDPQAIQRPCLRVRTVTYDSAGLKQAVGNWQVFHDDIERYRHQPGVRNIVRVRRYTQTAPAGTSTDGQTHAWVLDAIIESETVNP